MGKTAISLGESGMLTRTGRMKGVVMVLAAAVFWGVSGTAAQVLFQYNQFNPGWLVAVRMMASGLLLLLAGSLHSGPKQIFRVWFHRGDAFRLVLFSVLGLLGVQYSYFASIATGNAATATLLQYLGPLFITLYLAVRWRRIPNMWELSSVVLALFGTFLLVTEGKWHGLSVPAESVVWGLLSALTLAFYTLYPNGLLQRHGAIAVVGWSMIIGGVSMACKNPPWNFVGHGSTEAWFLVGFVVVFGTLLAFYLYLMSLKYLSPSETSVLACAEPLSAAIVAILFLHVHMGTMAVLGGICILATVIILALKRSSYTA